MPALVLLGTWPLVPSHRRHRMVPVWDYFRDPLSFSEKPRGKRKAGPGAGPGAGGPGVPKKKKQADRD